MRREFLRYQGDKMDYLKKKNPKAFYRLFRKNKRNPISGPSLSDFYDHFKTISSAEEEKQSMTENVYSPSNDSSIYPELNEPITAAEVTRIIKRLKKEKSPGVDNLLNEYFIIFNDYLTTYLVKLFNIVFQSGIFPNIWSEGIIAPVFKKGNVKDCNNYRGITLVSCLSKIFTAILNERLNLWSSNEDVISDAQFGFKSGFSTTDAIFVLHALINRNISSGKKLYCCFVDYQKAFDRIDRNMLFFKLAKHGIDCQMFRIIKSMYSNIKSCVRHNNQLSKMFNCNEGLMQGESLSPFLFSLYVNDFEMEFIENMCVPVEIKDIVLFLIMYADDTVLFSETEQGLQDMLNCLENYTSKWNIKVNVDKTKIIVFRRGGKLKSNYCWKYDNKLVSVDESFNYLGITLNFNGKFQKTQNVLASQCKKSLNSLLAKMKNLHLNVTTQLSLFDTYIGSLANYGCEVWGSHPAYDLENVHLNFCKKVLGVKKTTMSMMVYNELGRMPLHVQRKYKILKYWLKLKKTNNCILKSIYQEMLEVCHSKSFNCWLTYVRDLLYSLGFGYVWNCTSDINENKFLYEVKQRLLDVFIQELNSSFEMSPKCSLYKYVNEGFKLQLYLTKPIPSLYVQYISKYRLSSHRLEIEQGRFNNIPRNERKCKLCLECIEDEYHFILACPFYNDCRKQYLKKYYYKHPSTFKLIQLLSTENITELCKLGKYLHKCSSIRSQLLSLDYPQNSYVHVFQCVI